MLLMYKFYMGLLPKAFSGIFKYKSETAGVETRQANLLYVPICKSQIAYNSVRHKGVQYWNENCKKISPLCSYYAFKSALRKYLVNSDP